MRALLLFCIISIANVGISQASELEPCSNENGKVGFCDPASGSVVIEHKFEEAFGFINGHAPVKDGSKWGIIDEAGNWMVKPVYDEVLNCDNLPEMILVRDGDDWSLINPYGIQMTHEYEVAFPIHEFDITNSTAHFTKDSWFAVIKNGKWGAINVDDEVKIRFIFDWVRILRMKDGSRFAVLKKDGKFGWSHADERTVSGFTYDNYLGNSQNIAFFKKDGESVLLDMDSGKEIDQTSAQYHAIINTDDQMGLVNAKGEIILPFEYQFVDIFSLNELVIFGTPGSVGISDREGNVILRQTFAEIRPIEAGSDLLRIRNASGKEAIYKVEGTHLTNITGFVLDNITLEEDGISVTSDDRSGQVNDSGEVTWQE